MPIYGPLGLDFVAVHTQAQSANGVKVAERVELEAPLVFDFEREFHRLHRPAGSVFPVHWVFDPEGRLVHTDTGPELHALRPALEALFGEQ